MTYFQASMQPMLHISLLYLNTTIIPYGSSKPLKPLSNTK
jgi:hypothetical protein